NLLANFAARNKIGASFEEDNIENVSFLLIVYYNIEMEVCVRFLRPSVRNISFGVYGKKVRVNVKKDTHKMDNDNENKCFVTCCCICVDDGYCKLLN
ncbi:hypothetical protein, partial [Hoylesella pleuritidis]|uniref:hypothetical protein n=1 Tax=Hoylesella pleuritidis TaxID=407975 RepID=UPI002355DA28